MVTELNIRPPKVADLLHMAKEDRHPADLEVALTARLLETSFEEVVEWPSQAFRPVHRWLAPLVDMSGGHSSD